MRAYRITLTRDLFGAFMVETRYGRIGSYGHTLTHSFDDETAARGFMDTCLRRRQSAPKRIGVTYEPVAH
jgi:predicted DNA-binding WGR domain protein